MEEVQIQTETQHEAHTHARPRLLIGVGAVIVIALVATFVWSQWGSSIKEACLGEEEACTVTLPETDEQENIDFSVSTEVFNEEY